MAKKQKALSKKDKAMIKKALLKSAVKQNVDTETRFVSRLIETMKLINQQQSGAGETAKKKPTR